MTERQKNGKIEALVYLDIMSLGAVGGSGMVHNVCPAVIVHKGGIMTLGHLAYIKMTPLIAPHSIFMLELDEETGLRDYSVSYEENIHSDPYFGRKIAGATWPTLK